MDSSGSRRRAVAADARTHAVILSGGGAKGAYEIGVMKALFPGYARAVSDGREIDPIVYTGTSVGSYNAAYMASRPGRNARTAVGELEDIWRNRIASSYNRPNGVLRFRANPFDGTELDRMFVDPFGPLRNALDDGAFFAREAIERTQAFFASRERLTSRAMQLIDFSAFVCTDPLHDLIRDTVDLRELLANRDRAVVIAATNWEQGEVKLFGNLEPRGALAGLCPLDEKIGHRAILASTAIPGIFPAVEINHTKYVDGGILLNTPLGAALDALRAQAPGADGYVLHVIYLDPDLKDVPLGQMSNTLDAVNRLAALAFAGQVNRDIKHAKHINQSLELLRTAEARLSELRPAAREGSPTAESRTATAASSALEDVQRPFRPFVKDEYRPLSIHRYHPRSMLGGIFGLLAFESENISALIEQGFQDAVTHDCDASGCIFPSHKDVTAAARASRRSKVGRSSTVQR
jgi:predicted acylesterase/phospholipase RssA